LTIRSTRVERPKRLLHLRDQHHRAALGRLAAMLDVIIGAEQPDD